MDKKTTLIISYILVFIVITYYILVTFFAKKTSDAILDDFVFTSDSLEMKNKQFEKKSDSILKEIERMKIENTVGK